MNCLLLAVLTVSATACKVNPAYLNRWENREGSEEKFVEYLQDSSLSHETRVRALELLVKYWRFSVSMMREGAPLAEIQDIAERESIIRDAIPAIERVYSDEGDSDENKTKQERIRVADAAYQISQVVQDPELYATLQGITGRWISEEWEPCVRPTGSSASVRDMLRFVGSEHGMTRIIELAGTVDFDRLLCVLSDTEEIEWRNGNAELALVLREKFSAGYVPEHPQAMIDYLDAYVTIGTSEADRAWMFEQVVQVDLDYIEDERIDRVVRGYLIRLLMETTDEQDTSEWVGLLEREDTNRWSAFQSLVKIGNAEGIETALANLPAESDYSNFSGAGREDGFRRNADRVCALPRIEDIKEEARGVFENHIGDENLFAQAIAIRCLGELGNNASIDRLREAGRGLGDRADEEIPWWRNDENEPVTFEELIAESILDIETPDEEEEEDEAGDEASDEDAEEAGE